MQKFRTTVVLATTLALVGCQTLDGVTMNGQELNNRSVKAAQAGGCGLACVVGLGVAGAIVIGLAAGSGGGHSAVGVGSGNPSGSGGSGSSGGSGGSGAGQWDY